MSNFPRAPKSVAYTAQAITLDDSNDLTYPVEAFMCGTNGNLKISTVDGSVVTLYALMSGVIYPIAVKRFWSTGTSVSNVTGLS